MVDLDSTLLSGWVDWDAPLIDRPCIDGPMASGVSHRSYRIRGQSAEGENLLFVARLDNPASRSLAVPLLQEVRAMQLARGLAPRVVYRGDNLLVTEYENAPHWRPGDQLQRLGDALRQLHRLTPTNAIDYLDLTAHCSQYRRKLGDLGNAQPLFDEALRWSLETQHRFPQACLCHNDLNPQNILVDDRRLVFIDWEYSAINSPWFDLASLAEFGQLSNTQLNQLYVAYSGDEALNLASDAIKAFRPIVRLVEWLWLRLLDNAGAESSRDRLQTLLRSR